MIGVLEPAWQGAHSGARARRGLHSPPPLDKGSALPLGNPRLFQPGVSAAAPSQGRARSVSHARSPDPRSQLAFAPDTILTPLPTPAPCVHAKSRACLRNRSPGARAGIPACSRPPLSLALSLARAHALPPRKSWLLNGMRAGPGGHHQ
jgi:hypothetical protein